MAPSLKDSAPEEQINSAKKLGKKIVFVSGNFNVLHPGHIRLLKFAKDCGDFLIVGVHADALSNNLVKESLRLEGIQVISFVDAAFLISEAPAEFIKRVKPDIVVKGKEWETVTNPEHDTIDSYGGKLIFSSGEAFLSSVDFIRNEYKAKELKSIIHADDFFDRHSLKKELLLERIASFSKMRILVLGDLIIDDYLNCDPIGMSQEDPTIVVTPVAENRYLGGAGIVAAHGSGLGAKVSFFTVAGTDLACEFAKQKLEEYGVTANIILDNSRPTTLKQRFRCLGKTLLRVSRMKDHEMAKALQKDLIARVKQSIAKDKYDLAVFSDFNYGFLSQTVVSTLSELFESAGVMVVADSQSSSQVGDISRFKKMFLITPTEREARLALRDFNSGLVVLAEKLRRKSSAKNVVVTLSSEGVLVHANTTTQQQTDIKPGWVTDRLMALNKTPKDTAGAGDSLLITASMALAAGASIWEASYLGSLAAAIQVSRVGNVPVSKGELEREILEK